MKKILSLILILIMALSFAACGNKSTDDVANTDTQDQQVVDKNEEEIPEEPVEDETEVVEEEEKEPEKEPEKKPEVKPESKPESKPEAKPETKPEVKPEEKPAPEPEAKPEATQSVGNTLLADFKAKAGSHSSAVSLAEALLANPVIKFSGGAMAVEPGFLTGFDNAEIKGFKEGAMFAPMIGTIPFVGYVFILEDGTNASDFISTLKSSANLRWNICTTADEMLAGSSGNKVFFVMSPKAFEE